jgi:hypothetical protein
VAGKPLWQRDRDTTGRSITTTRAPLPGWRRSTVEGGLVH